MLLFSILSPFESWYCYVYAASSDSNLLQIIYEAPSAEIHEFLASIPFIQLTLLAILTGYIHTLAYAPRQNSKKARSKRLTIYLSLLGIIPILAGTLIHDVAILSFTDKNDPIRLFGSRTGHIIGQSYPFGVLIRGYQFTAQRARLKSAANALQALPIPKASKNTPPNLKIILVIGESSRKLNWSLYGYKLPTNPLLQKQKNIILFKDAISGWNATRLAVPKLLVEHASRELLPEIHKQPITTIFNKVGFTSYWLSNQQSLGIHNTPISLIASTAIHQKFYNLGGDNQNKTFDKILIAPTQAALASSHLSFIVIHTMGSHTQYQNRTPSNFKSQHAIPLQQNENPYFHYDASIAYTDEFLSELIDLLQKDNTPALLLYLSDHGESLKNDVCGGGHGFQQQDNYEIPMLIWYSNSYKVYYPEKIASLKKNQAAPIHTGAAISSTLLDLAGITHANMRHFASLASPQWQPSPRLIYNNQTFFEYDAAEKKGPCKTLQPNQ